MRIGPAVLILLAALAAPASAQTCKKAPPPFLASLFPEAVSGLPVEFSTAPGGCMALYRPASESARASAPWAVVSAEVEPDPDLGESADGIRTRYAMPGTEILLVGDWPVAFSVRSTGDEFITVRGSVRIKVLVKNGDHGDASKALAIAFFERMLPGVRCG